MPTLAVAARTDARLDAPSHTQTQDYQGRHMVIRAIICRVIRATYAMIRLDIVGSVQQRLASDGIVFGLTEDPAMPFTWVIRVIQVIQVTIAVLLGLLKEGLNNPYNPDHSPVTCTTSIISPLTNHSPNSPSLWKRNTGVCERGPVPVACTTSMTSPLAKDIWLGFLATHLALVITFTPVPTYTRLPGLSGLPKLFKHSSQMKT